MTITENTAMHHLQLVGTEDDVHAGHRTEIALSLAEPFHAVDGMLPDYLAVQVWQMPDSAPPTVGLQDRGGDVADMTPSEAVALAAALVQAAWRIDPGAVEAIAAQDAGMEDPRAELRGSRACTVSRMTPQESAAQALADARGLLAQAYDMGGGMAVADLCYVAGGSSREEIAARYEALLQGAELEPAPLAPPG
jgi:hypothetical protein